jgi:hypothetical protein
VAWAGSCSLKEATPLPQHRHVSRHPPRRCRRRQDLAAHSWPKRRLEDWFNHAESMSRRGKKCLQMIPYGGNRRRPSSCLTRPVTPEVAGSSPGAPAKVPANRHLLLPAWRNRPPASRRSRADPAGGFQVRLRSGKALEMATFLLLVEAPTDVPALGPSCADPARETGGHRERPRLVTPSRADLVRTRRPPSAIT